MGIRTDIEIRAVLIEAGLEVSSMETGKVSIYGGCFRGKIVETRLLFLGGREGEGATLPLRWVSKPTCLSLFPFSKLYVLKIIRRKIVHG